MLSIYYNMYRIMSHDRNMLTLVFKFISKVSLYVREYELFIFC